MSLVIACMLQSCEFSIWEDAELVIPMGSHGPLPMETPSTTPSTVSYEEREKKRPVKAASSTFVFTCPFIPEPPPPTFSKALRDSLWGNLWRAFTLTVMIKQRLVFVRSSHWALLWFSLLPCWALTLLSSKSSAVKLASRNHVIGPWLLNAWVIGWEILNGRVWLCSSSSVVKAFLISGMDWWCDP